MEKEDQRNNWEKNTPQSKRNIKNRKWRINTFEKGRPNRHLKMTVQATPKIHLKETTKRRVKLSKQSKPEWSKRSPFHFNMRSNVEENTKARDQNELMD